MRIFVPLVSVEYRKSGIFRLFLNSQAQPVITLFIVSSSGIPSPTHKNDTRFSSDAMYTNYQNGNPVPREAYNYEGHFIFISKNTNGNE